MLELQNVGRNSLQDFLVRWYGDSFLSSPVVGSMDRNLPWPMRNWYELLRRGKEGFSKYYRFRGEQELANSGGLVLFCLGPPSDPYLWAYQDDIGDPPTFESCDGKVWHSTGIPLSGLLLYIAVSSAVYSSLHSLVNMASGESNCRRATARMEPLVGDLWAWPDPRLRFYFTDGILAQAGCVDGDFGYQIIIAAVSAERLNLFDDLIWEWDSRKDRPIATGGLLRRE